MMVHFCRKIIEDTHCLEGASQGGQREKGDFRVQHNGTPVKKCHTCIQDKPIPQERKMTALEILTKL